jgi:hypothetical protein
MYFGDTRVVINHWNGGDYVVHKCRSTDLGVPVGEFDPNAKFGDGDGRDRHIIIVFDGLIECVAGTLGVDEERGIEEKACQGRSSTFKRSRSLAKSVAHFASTR